jgi:lactose/L-arabinose transport system permease protein
MKQNIEQTILTDMLNGARVDGASELEIFYKIVLPLIRPALAALAVFLFLYRMNELFWPLIIMRSPDHQLATTFISNNIGGLETPTTWTVVMPAAFLATVPVLLVFIFLQKQFIKGLLAGSVKN